MERFILKYLLASYSDSREKYIVLLSVSPSLQSNAVEKAMSPGR